MTELKFAGIFVTERGVPPYPDHCFTPVIRTFTPSGRVRDIDLTEDDLHKVIGDAAKALRFLKARRPESAPSSIHTREG
jgi:hypothetical protein